MWIERPPEWFRSLFPDAIFRLAGKESHNKVYLTFDDGPIPVVTPWVLDTLDRFQAKATFFMVGQNIERNPELLREIKERGHNVGNHTFHHIKGLGISAKDYRKDVEDCERYTNSKLFRPPHGWLTGAQLKEMKKDYKVVMYDLVTRDYSKRTSPQDVLNNVKKLTRNGSIIVFHDSIKSYEKLKHALPLCLQWLKQQGYSFGLLN